MKQKTEVLTETEAFVRKTLQHAEKGHDWWHIDRVRSNARLIGKTERADMFIVELGALLHDIADFKFHDGDEEIGPRIAREFLATQGVDVGVIEHVENIIRHVSFKGDGTAQEWMSPELAIVQDADRLDALGAIGIARTFHYGGHKNREIYDPARPPQRGTSSEEYKKSDGSTINHFYEKLLLLKDRMNTDSGRRVAEDRHRFLEQFLDQFFTEWKGKR